MPFIANKDVKYMVLYFKAVLFESIYSKNTSHLIINFLVKIIIAYTFSKVNLLLTQFNFSKQVVIYTGLYMSVQNYLLEESFTPDQKFLVENYYCMYFFKSQPFVNRPSYVCSSLFTRRKLHTRSAFCRSES